MRLTRRFLIAFTVAILAVVGLDATARLAREVSFFEWDMRRDANFAGRVLATAVAKAWQSEGEAAAQRLVHEVDAQGSHIRLRWVWLDDAAATKRLDVASRDALLAGETVSRREDPSGDGAGALFTYAPVRASTEQRGAIELREPLEEERDYLHLTWREILFEASGLLLASGAAASALGFFFIGRPMRLLVAKARRVGQGDLTGPLTLPQNDELGELANEINAMCEHLAEANARVQSETVARVAAVQQLRHADRLMTVGKLASGIAHELGTPLNVISGRAQMIAEGDSSDVQSDAKIIGDQTQRVTRIIRQLLDFARRGRTSKTLVDLRLLAAQCVAMVSALATKGGVALSVAEGAPVESLADDGQMQQALTNLVVNALQATPSGGSVRVDVGVEETQPPADHGGPREEYAFLRVTDTGAGMDRDTLGRIFEPFFTTKDVGEGTGLGLSVSYGIVRDHGGFIDVDSEPGTGSRFTIHLPRAAEGAVT